MRSLRLLIYSIVLAIPLVTHAQNGTEVLPRGARSMGLGNAHVTATDAWAVFNNIGALARIEESQAFVSYDHRMALNELTTLGAGAAWKRPSGVWGLALGSFGAAHFNQQSLGIGYAHSLGIASLGVKANYFQTNIEGFGRGGSAVLEFGGVADLGPQVLFGAHIYNPTRAKMSKLSSEYLPTVVRAGVTYLPTEFLRLSAEVEKEITLPPLLRMALEYRLQEKLDLRTGIHPQGGRLFFGIGFRPQKYRIDYAVSQHQQLGFNHHFSFNLLWSEK